MVCSMKCSTEVPKAGTKRYGEADCFFILHLSARGFREHGILKLT